MAFNFKFKLPSFNFKLPKFGFSKIGTIFRFIFLKIIGVAFCAIFLSLGAIFVGYSVVSVASTLRGQDAKIVSVTPGQVGKYRASFRLGGLFEISAEMSKKKYGKIYCLYPVWPDSFTPMKGDSIRIWPVKQPLAGAPAVSGWGWFIIGTLFILGLVMLEFAFLALMMS